MSTLLVCSSPDTDSVVLPGATAVTTPVSDTRATFGSADAHCIVRGLTTRFPCPGTITCSVSTSLGPRVAGLGSWIAMSLGCTTTGAVAVSPVELVTCTVPWPADSATITPFWSTLAISGRSDFHVTATGAAGEPSSLSARGTTRVFSGGSRDTVGGSIRLTETRPVPGGWAAGGSTPPGPCGGRAVVLERARHDARVLGRQQVHGRGLDPHDGSRARAGGLARERIDATSPVRRSGRRLRWRARLRAR